MHVLPFHLKKDIGILLHKSNKSILQYLTLDNIEEKEKEITKDINTIACEKTSEYCEEVKSTRVQVEQQSIEMDRSEEQIIEALS